MQQIPETIRNAIEAINLPSIPNVLLRFMHVVEDDHASMTELATLVGQDPALSARFLTVANSPALRRETGTRNIEQCLVALGTRLSRTLAACLAIQSVFSRIAEEPQYDLRGFWEHSLRVAEIARELAARTNYDDIEEAYLGALLHDVGQLLLLGGVGKRYGDLLRCSVDEAVLPRIEEPALGTDHAMVGAWLVDQWKLPSFMSDAILFHHKPAEEIADADPLSRIVWSAHIVNSHGEKSGPAQKNQAQELAAATSMMGIGPADAVAIRRRSCERIADLAAALGVTGVTGITDAATLPSAFIPCNDPHADRNDNEAASSGIEAMVRDMAMMRALQRDLAALSHESEILLAVREAARILFGLERIAFFFVKPGTPRLSGAHFDGQPVLLRQLEIALDPGHSLIAATASGERAWSTLDTELPTPISLVDVQIAHAIDSEGLLYVPMRGRERLVGIMVYGLTLTRHARIQRYLDWMTSFAHLAAASIESYRETQEQAQKLETKLAARFEQKARKVVHETGNPLSIIKNYLKIVSRKLPAGNSVHQELEILKEEIDRVANILQKLGNLAETAPAMAAVDINGVIEGMLALYSESLFSMHGIAVEKQLAPDLPLITGDRDSVKQILFNLWKNAAEAMPDGGRFAISTHGNTIRNGRLHAEIRLSDSGPGLPEDVVQRLFQPLDPNRRQGHSGIGLSIVASLVETLNGTITHQSNDGQGTCFSILLPQSEAAEP